MGCIVLLCIYFQTGETISPGDILCDIQTDKAVVSFEMEEEGILAKILAINFVSEPNDQTYSITNIGNVENG